MDYKHCCVVDAQGNYKTIVLVQGESIRDYTLLPGERLLEARPPANLLKARWNGSAWEEAATPEEIEAADPRTAEEARAAKLAELSAACNAAIVAGCGVELSDGSAGHFSLQETDQINLTNAYAAIEQGAAGYPYHADGQLCRLFPAADIAAIVQAATKHKLYHTTYCNHLMTWARRLENRNEIDAVAYGAELPADLAANLEEVLGIAQAG